tara:strand:+ start:2848 stop:3933 length:1086 start_codon:yes stop_codon:yes gene_type:complete
MKGKKYFVISILSFFYNLFTKQKTLIILDAPALFHFAHFENIISILADRNDIDVIVICPDIKPSDKIINITYYQCIENIPLFKKPDLFISTELNRIPYWYNCPTVYFGHGMGPKLNYAANSDLLEYNYIFSPCNPTYKLQKELVSEQQIYPLGMPILDNKENNKTEIIKFFNLNQEKPIIVYAPSWCTDINKLSDINKIVAFLRTKTNYFNIIISAHPLLFKKERCEGKEIFNVNKPIEGITLNLPSSNLTTLELIKSSDIVISDISSILFEAMALNKKVLFDGNKAIYEYSKALHIYEEVIQVCHTPCWDDFEDKTIENVIEFDDLHSQRERFINNYLFNNGNASTHFIQEVENILKRDS